MRQFYYEPTAQLEEKLGLKELKNKRFLSEVNPNNGTLPRKKENFSKSSSLIKRKKEDKKTSPGKGVKINERNQERITMKMTN